MCLWTVSIAEIYTVLLSCHTLPSQKLELTCPVCLWPSCSYYDQVLILDLCRSEPPHFSQGDHGSSIIHFGSKVSSPLQRGALCYSGSWAEHLGTRCQFAQMLWVTTSVKCTSVDNTRVCGWVGEVYLQGNNEKFLLGWGKIEEIKVILQPQILLPPPNRKWKLQCIMNMW